MAEEGDQVEQGTEQQSQQQEQQQQQQERQYTAIELKAMEQGWKPLEEWEGEPDEHRSAKEYLDRGDLLKTIKQTNSKVREMEAMLTHLSAQNKRVYEAGYQKALVDLKSQRAEAMREGDVDKVLQIEEKIDETKEALNTIKRAPVTQVQQGPTPAYQDWLSKNQWYLKDASLHHWTNGMSAEYFKINPHATEQEVLDYLHEEIRKEFPNKPYFKGSSLPKGPPGPDGGGRRSAEGAGKGKGKDEFEELVSSLSEVEQRVARNLVKQGYVTKEKYVEDYKVGGNR